MDSVFVSIGKFLDVVDPIALVIPNLTAELPQDRPMETLRLVVGLRVVRACE